MELPFNYQMLVICRCKTIAIVQVKIIHSFKISFFSAFCEPRGILWGGEINLNKINNKTLNSENSSKYIFSKVIMIMKVGLRQFSCQLQNLDDSKTSDTVTVNLTIIHYFHFWNCSKGRTCLIHSSEITFDLSSKLLFALLMFMKRNAAFLTLANREAITCMNHRWK